MVTSKKDNLDLEGPNFGLTMVETKGVDDVIPYDVFLNPQKSVLCTKKNDRCIVASGLCTVVLSFGIHHFVFHLERRT